MAMTPEDAAEFVEAHSQTLDGWWRIAALGIRLGVPDALGIDEAEYRERLGRPMKLSIAERREAVAELTGNGMTQRQIADVLDVGIGTVNRDLNVPNGTSETDHQPEPSPDVPNGTLSDEDMAKLARWQELADQPTPARPDPSPAIAALGHALSDLDLARRVRTPDDVLTDLLDELRRTLEDF